MKKIFIIFTLTIIFVSIFLPNFAYAKENFDVSITLTYDNVRYKYSLSDSLEKFINKNNISSQSINDRMIYRSVKYKKDKVKSLLEQGFTLPQAMCYVLPNFNNILNKISKNIDKKAIDSQIYFNNGVISISPDCNGIKVNVIKLCEKIFDNFSNDMSFVVPTDIVRPRLTYLKAVDITQLKGVFSTDFSSSGESRIHNIALSLSKINGLIVKPNQKISFNQVVGERTAEKGFLTAKIILDGKYVDGIGGGVCQVSSTLYNALLLSNLMVNVRCKHSLISNYVEAGFDAMVNSYSADLIFTNNTESDIYISAKIVDKRAEIKIYGVKNPYRIERMSKIIERNPCETKIVIDVEQKYLDKVRYKDEFFVLTNGSDKVISESYLLYYNGENLVKKIMLRRDVYFPMDRIVVYGSMERPQEYFDEDS